jgi:hypothetical protein
MAIGICLCGVSLVFADYQPLPNTGGYTGVDFGLSITGYVNSTVDGGGEFYGTVTPSDSVYPSVITNFWCVDDQEVFAFGQTGTANITPLGSIGAPNANSPVRYDNVGTGTYTWTNTTVPTGADSSLTLPTDAQDRYQMAAYLVSLYNFSSNSTVDNNAIQEAIWAITNNNSGNGTPGQYEPGYSDLSLASGPVNGYVQQAFEYYQNPTKGASLSNWAVVSWGASATGVLGSGAYNASNSANQTFLVELGTGSGTTGTGVSNGGGGGATPEPGFYGLLALGLGGLFFAARWKKA